MCRQVTKIDRDKTIDLYSNWIIVLLALYMRRSSIPSTRTKMDPEPDEEDVDYVLGGYIDVDC